MKIFPLRGIITVVVFPAQPGHPCPADNLIRIHGAVQPGRRDERHLLSCQPAAFHLGQHRGQDARDGRRVRAANKGRTRRVRDRRLAIKVLRPGQRAGWR